MTFLESSKGFLSCLVLYHSGFENEKCEKLFFLSFTSTHRNFLYNFSYSFQSASSDENQFPAYRKSQFTFFPIHLQMSEQKTFSGSHVGEVAKGRNTQQKRRKAIPKVIKMKVRRRYVQDIMVYTLIKLMFVFVQRDERKSAENQVISATRRRLPTCVRCKSKSFSRMMKCVKKKKKKC